MKNIDLHLTEEEEFVPPEYEAEAEKIISTVEVIENTKNSLEVISEKVENSEPEIKLTEGKSPKTPNKNLAQQYVELKQTGMEEDKIFRTLGIPRKAISPADIQLEVFKKTLNENYLKDELRRVLVKNSRNKVLADALLNQDNELILKAAKDIAGEPEIGLLAPPITQVNISLEKVQQALEKANVIDFEFEDEK
jgi:hypothetical protein